jgi:hypothetical protein
MSATPGAAKRQPIVDRGSLPSLLGSDTEMRPRQLRPGRRSNALAGRFASGLGPAGGSVCGEGLGRGWAVLRGIALRILCEAPGWQHPTARPIVTGRLGDNLYLWSRTLARADPASVDRPLAVRYSYSRARV